MPIYSLRSTTIAVSDLGEIFWKKSRLLLNIVQKGGGGSTRMQKFFASFFWAFFWMKGGAIETILKKSCVVFG